MRYLAILLSFSAVLSLACSPGGRGKIYPNRWMYASKNLTRESDIEELRAILTTASEHGINGMVLSAGFDRLDLAGPDYFRGLEEVKKICAEKNVEIIPTCLGIGYNGALLSHDKNLAAGIPVKDALFLVSAGEARLIPDPPVAIANGGFEKHKKSVVSGFEIPGKPGEVVFLDKKTVKEGKTSLRFENFGGLPGNPARVIQELKVGPHRCYRVTLWVKTEGLDPDSPFGSGRFRVRAAGADGRPLTWFDPRVPSETGWRKVVVGFNSRDNEKITLTAGVFEGKTGRFWMDGLKIEEIGLVNVLRRPGTPLRVKNDKTGELYKEGVDFAPVADPQINFRFNHDGPAIKILPGGKITEGRRLRVSWYHGTTVYQGQVTACMSEPKVFEIWRTNAELVHKHLAPKKYFLKHDEIRAGGACEACRSRGMTMGEMLGDCITRQMAMVREINPEAEFYVWSDMLDPNHNGGDRGGTRNYYYHVDGTFTGSWLHVPRDLIMVAWWHRMRRKSLDQFSGLGHRTMGAGYYDADILTNDSTWLAALDSTEGALGLMYTTWRNKYELLDEFGDMLMNWEPVAIDESSE